MPTSTCLTTGCDGSCPNSNCLCAPAGYMVPYNTCPDGSVPGSTVNDAKNGRAYSKCAQTDVSVNIGGTVLSLKGSTLGQLLYMVNTTDCSSTR